MSAMIAASGTHVSDSVANELTKSFSGAAEIAKQHPQYASQITAAAKTSFLHGDQWAYTAGIVAVLIGAAVVFLFFPKLERERRLLAEYQAEGSGDAEAAVSGERQPVPPASPAAQPR